MYKTTDVRCADCGATEILLHLRSETPEKPCECGGQMVKTLSAPLVLRASFAEGQKRGDRWTYLKESAKLEQKASHLRKNGKRSEASEMLSESKELNKRAAVSRDKTDK